MTNILVILCVGLIVACMIGKDSARRNVAKLQGELTTLRREEQAAEYENRQDEAVQAVTQGRERELMHDSLQLTNQLGELQAQIAEVEARSKKGGMTQEKETEE